MEIFCPRCKAKTNELIECENCRAIGCVKCILRIKGKWLCENCRKEAESKESLFSMFD